MAKQVNYWQGYGKYLINNKPYQVTQVNEKVKIYHENKENLAVYINSQNIENQCNLGEWIKI
jgi:hypothetical protein